MGGYGVPDDNPDRALVYLDHSDQFLPQGINAVKVTFSFRYKIKNFE